MRSKSSLYLIDGANQRRMGAASARISRFVERGGRPGRSPVRLICAQIDRDRLAEPHVHRRSRQRRRILRRILKGTKSASSSRRPGALARSARSLIRPSPRRYGRACSPGAEPHHPRLRAKLPGASPVKCCELEFADDRRCRCVALQQDAARAPPQVAFTAARYVRRNRTSPLARFSQARPSISSIAKLVRRSGRQVSVCGRPVRYLCSQSRDKRRGVDERTPWAANSTFGNSGDA
jgi:hypothetical protein